MWHLLFKLPGNFHYSHIFSLFELPSVTAWAEIFHAEGQLQAKYFTECGREKRRKIRKCAYLGGTGKLHLPTCSSTLIMEDQLIKHHHHLLFPWALSHSLPKYEQCSLDQKMGRVCFILIIQCGFSLFFLRSISPQLSRQN